MKKPKPRFSKKSTDPPKTDTVVSGTPAYDKAYAERRLVSGRDANTDTYNMAQMLDEVVVTPQNKGTFEQDIRDARTRTLTGALELMGEPQKRMMQGITGKMQTPSQAWGFDTADKSWYHPKSISNFAMDAVADPTNLLGAGLVDDALRIGGRQAIGRGVRNAAERIATPKDIKTTSELAGNVFETWRAKNYPTRLTSKQKDELHSIRTIGKIIEENTGRDGLRKAVKHIDKVDDSRLKKLTGMNKEEIMRYVDQTPADIKKAQESMGSIDLTRRPRQNTRRTNFEEQQTQYGTFDEQIRMGIEDANLQMNNSYRPSGADLDLDNQYKSFNWDDYKPKPKSALSKLNDKLQNFSDEYTQIDDSYRNRRDYGDLLENATGSSVLTANSWSNPVRAIVKAKSLFENSKPGYKVLPSSSLSTDSFNLAYSLVPDIAKKKVGDVNYLGMHSMNQMGFLSRAGVDPKLIAAEMNETVNKIRKASGKNIPYSRVKDGQVYYPDIGLEKKRMGGKMTIGSISGTDKQKVLFAETFEKADYGHDKSWPNKYKKELLGRGLPAVYPLPFKKGGKIDKSKFKTWKKEDGGKILWGAPQSQRGKYLAQGGTLANKQFGDKTIGPVSPYRLAEGGKPLEPPGKKVIPAPAGLELRTEPVYKLKSQLDEKFPERRQWPGLMNEDELQNNWWSTQKKDQWAESKGHPYWTPTMHRTYTPQEMKELNIQPVTQKEVLEVDRPTSYAEVHNTMSNYADAKNPLSTFLIKKRIEDEKRKALEKSKPTYKIGGRL